jgi:hypothetical protein
MMAHEFAVVLQRYLNRTNQDTEQAHRRADPVDNASFLYSPDGGVRAGRYNIVISESKASFNLSMDQLRRFHWDIAMGGANITELDWWYRGATIRAPSTQKLQSCGNLANY